MFSSTKYCLFDGKVISIISQVLKSLGWSNLHLDKPMMVQSSLKSFNIFVSTFNPSHLIFQNYHVK